MPFNVDLTRDISNRRNVPFYSIYGLSENNRKHKRTVFYYYSGVSFSRDSNIIIEELLSSAMKRSTYACHECMRVHQ